MTKSMLLPFDLTTTWAAEKSPAPILSAEALNDFAALLTLECSTATSPDAPAVSNSSAELKSLEPQLNPATLPPSEVAVISDVAAPQMIRDISSEGQDQLTEGQRPLALQAAEPQESFQPALHALVREASFDEVPGGQAMAASPAAASNIQQTISQTVSQTVSLLRDFVSTSFQDQSQAESELETASDLSSLRLKSDQLTVGADLRVCPGSDLQADLNDHTDDYLINGARRDSQVSADEQLAMTQPLARQLASAEHDSRFNQPLARAEASPRNRVYDPDEPEQRAHALSAELTLSQLGLAQAELRVVNPVTNDACDLGRLQVENSAPQSPLSVDRFVSEVGTQQEVEHSKPLASLPNPDAQLEMAVNLAPALPLTVDTQFAQVAQRSLWFSSLPQMTTEIRRNLAESGTSLSLTEARRLNMDTSESNAYTGAGALGQAAEVETLNTLALQFELPTGGQFGIAPNSPTGLDLSTAQATKPPEVAATLQPFERPTPPQFDLTPQNESAPQAQADPTSAIRRTVELQSVMASQFTTLPVDAVLAELVAAYARPSLAEPNKLQPARLSVGLLTRETATPTTFIAEVSTPDEQHWPVALLEQPAKAQGDVADNLVPQRIFAEELIGRADAQDEFDGVTPVTAKLGPVVPGTPLAQVTIRSAGHVAEQLAEPIIAASDYIAPGVLRNLRLKLRPAELGQVEIELTRDAAGRLDARLTVRHEETSRVLGDELGRLREALERAGLQVGRLDVSTYVSEHGSGWDTNRQSPQPDYAEAQAFAPAADAESIAFESNLTGGAQAAQDRLLNLHA